MRTPDLIQRGTFKNVSGPITGFDMLIDLDYMGSSEFEFGALPKSLKRICVSINLFNIVHSGWTDHNGAGLFIICAESLAVQVKEFVDNLVNGTYRLKEPTYLLENMEGTNGSWRHTTFWWDIENDYMFCFGKQNAVKVLKAIKAVRDRKKAEGVEGWY